MSKRQKLRDERGLILPSELEFFDVFQNFQAGDTIDLTPENISSILKDAELGNATRQVTLFNLLEDKENVIKGLMQTRINSVLGKKWNIVGSSNEAKNKEIEHILAKADIHKYIQNNMHGFFYGYNGNKIAWENAGRSIKNFEQIETTRWNFDEYGTIFLYDGNNNKKIYFTPKSRESEYAPEDFLTPLEINSITFFNCNMRGGIPSNTGIFRSLIWQFYKKFFMMKNQMRTIELYGIPFLTAKVSKQDFNDNAKLSAVQDSLENLGANGNGVFADDMKIDTMAINKGVEATDLINAMQKIDDDYAKLILGQTASSGDSSGMSNGNEQSAVRNDILQSDCRAIENLINNQVLPILEFNKYGTNDMRFVIDSHPKIDIAPQISAFKDLNTLLEKSNKSVSVDYIIDTLGIPVVDNKSSDAIDMGNGVNPNPVSSPDTNGIDLSKLSLNDVSLDFKDKLKAL